MRKGKRVGLFFTVISITVVLCFLVWFLSLIFEGEKPSIEFQPLPKYLSGRQNFNITVRDMKRGLRVVDVSVNQGERKIGILKKNFPFRDLFNREGVHEFKTQFSIDPAMLNLAQGEVWLEVSVWDYSRRRGGDGNMEVLRHKMVVDTIQPAIRAISRLHYVSRGGTGLVVYQTSSDVTTSGIFVNSLFFPGFPADSKSQNGYHVCYFGIPHNIQSHADIHLWAQDRAGNTSTARFYYRILTKPFRTRRINISDRFLERVLPYFSSYCHDPNATDIEKFCIINRELRQKNAAVFQDLGKNTSHERLWEGSWLRLKDAACMANFADHRIYYYKGHKVDKAVHLGIDLASLANSEVYAANNGRVIYAQPLGIYGLTVVLDHGQGLASTYSHLSSITVKTGQKVSKGDQIGFTGQTGLAGGDHLHFGIMVSGLFVNPTEWWDPHWIQDNIIRKLLLLKK